MADPTSAILTSLKTVNLVPDVLSKELIEDKKWLPSVLFSITFPLSDASTKSIVLGEEIPLDTATQFGEPDIVFTPLNLPFNDKKEGEEESYTLAFLDPDAPTHADPAFRSFRHWVITGLKPSKPSATNETVGSKALKTKASITPYRGPGPRPESGFHRYSFLLFKEPPSFAGVPEGAKEYGAELEQRRSWDALKFAQEYGLELVGATWFGVRRDSE